MDTAKLIDLVIEKTKQGKLVWETTADESVYITTLGGQYIIRLIGAYSDYDPNYDGYIDFDEQLCLLTSDNQMIVSISANNEDVVNAHRVKDLWEIVKFGGLSAEEAAADAIKRLESL